jgi:hypothetical protein
VNQPPVDARRVSAGEWSLLERINEDIHPTDRHAADDSCILGSDGYPSANTTMTGEVARGLAAEIALQDVMLSSQTLSGAGGRALATELRHAISARSPTRSPERRMSTGDAHRRWTSGGFYSVAGEVNRERRQRSRSNSGDVAHGRARETAGGGVEGEAEGGGGGWTRGARGGAGEGPIGSARRAIASRKYHISTAQSVADEMTLSHFE